MKTLALGQLLALGLCALLGLGFLVQAQQFTMPPPAGVTVMGCVYNASPSTLTTANAGMVQCDSTGRLLADVTTGSTTAITAASGSFASGSQPIGITPTDRTVASATGASQTVMAANTTRKSLTLVNTGNANCGINPTGGTAAIGGAGTLTLAPLGSWTPRVPTLAAVTAICTAGQPLYADEAQ